MVFSFEPRLSRFLHRRTESGQPTLSRTQAGVLCFHIRASRGALADSDATDYHTPLGYTMAHTQRNRDKLLARIGRIRGQLNAAQTALEEQRDCADVLQILAACRGALSSLVAEVIEDHIRFHIAEPGETSTVKRAEAVEQLIEVLRTYMR